MRQSRGTLDLKPVIIDDEHVLMVTPTKSMPLGHPASHIDNLSAPEVTGVAKAAASGGLRQPHTGPHTAPTLKLSGLKNPEAQWPSMGYGTHAKFLWPTKPPAKWLAKGASFFY